MVRISTRYIGWQICKMILLILFIFACLQFILQFVADLSHIGHGRYTFAHSLACIALALPMQLYTLFSVIAFLGTVLGLGLMVQRNELVVFRASGLSLHSLLLIVLQSVAILVVAITLVGEIFAPKLNQLSVSLKQSALFDASQLEQHYWWKNQQDHYYFIRSTDHGDHVYGLGSLNVPLDKSGASMAFAEKADKSQNNWLTPKQTVTQVNEDHSDSYVLTNAKIPARIHITASKVARHAVDEESLLSLHQTIKERDEEGRSIGRFQMAYWSRLLQPLATLVLVVLGVPIVFSQSRRSTSSYRLLLGIAIGFSFYLINQLLAPVGVLMGWPPMIVVALPIVIYLWVAVHLLKQRL